MSLASKFALKLVIVTKHDKLFCFHNALVRLPTISISQNNDEGMDFGRHFGGKLSLVLLISAVVTSFICIKIHIYIYTYIHE